MTGGKRELQLTMIIAKTYVLRYASEYTITAAFSLSLNSE